jgi:hypothetical protein
LLGRSLLQSIKSPSRHDALGALILVSRTRRECGKGIRGDSAPYLQMGKSAGCGEGHVPKEFGPKRWRKIRAVSEIDHHLKGTIDHDLPAGIDVDELIEDIDF